MPFGYSVVSILTDCPGGPEKPRSPRCPGRPTVPRCPATPWGPEIPAGPWTEGNKGQLAHNADITVVYFSPSKPLTECLSLSYSWHSQGLHQHQEIPSLH